ncbi:MAG: CDP-diacylglycerol--serine O-phosphatidyltransferase [candidate division FCPU426 bacterium]
MKASRWVWLPNSFTAMNVLLGFLSILVSVSASLGQQGIPAAGEISPYNTACWLILWATLFDVLDGKLAKLTGTTSEFGMRLDTFADAVTFGLAPAVLIFCTFLSPSHLPSPLGWIACGVYFSAAVFRLARYNVQTAAEPVFGFIGLPTPAAALVGVSLYLSLGEASLVPAWAVACLMVLIGAAMVSPLRYPAFKGTYPLEKKVILGILLAMAAGTVVWGAALVLLVSWGSFALVWGWAWVPSRRFWVPELKGKKERHGHA